MTTWIINTPSSTTWLNQTARNYQVFASINDASFISTIDSSLATINGILQVVYTDTPNNSTTWRDDT